MSSFEDLIKKAEKERDEDKKIKEIKSIIRSDLFLEKYKADTPNYMRAKPGQMPFDTRLTMTEHSKDDFNKYKVTQKEVDDKYLEYEKKYTKKHLSDYEKEELWQKEFAEKQKQRREDAEAEAQAPYFDWDDPDNFGDQAAEYEEFEEKQKKENEKWEKEFEEKMKKQNEMEEARKISAKEEQDANIKQMEKKRTDRHEKLRDRMRKQNKARAENAEAAKTPEQKEREAKIKAEEDRRKAEEDRRKAEEDRRKAKIMETLQNKKLNQISEEDARLMGWLKDNDNINKLYSSSRFPDKKYIKTDKGTIWISENTNIKNDDGTFILLNALLNETTGGKKSKKVKRTKRSKKVKTSKKSRKNKRKSKKSKKKNRKTRRKY